MNIRVLVCTLAGLLGVILLLVFSPSSPCTPKGIALPAKKTLTEASRDTVVVYKQAPQSNFTIVGMVNAQIKFNTLNVQTEEALFQKVKTLAATLGANGVIVRALVPDNSIGHRLIFYRTAIYSSSRG